MTINEIISLISTLLSVIATVAVLIIAIGNKQRAKEGKRNALLSKLKCKKDEMNRKENNIYFLIQLFKAKAITKDAFESAVSHEYEQLRIIYSEYKEIKLEMSTEDLKTEKEDYSRSLEHIDSIIIKLTGGK